MAKGVAYAIISAVCFGMLAILGKLSFAYGFSSFQMLQYRFGFATLMLFVYFWLTDRSCLVTSRKTIAKAAFLGVCLYPVQSICYINSVKYIPASTTSLVFYFYPVLVTLLSACFFKTRITRVIVVALCLITLGCGLVFYDSFLRSISPTGVYLAVAATCIFSFYLICLQGLLRGENPRTVTFYVVLSAACVYTVLAPPTGFLALDGHGMLLALSLGLIPTALAVTLLYEAVDRIGSAYVSICSTLEPIATVVASAFLLGETIVPVQIAGMVLILLGILLPNLGLIPLWRQTRQPLPKA